MYKPLQKKNSSWTPTSIQKKGKSKPGTFTVQTFRDKSNEQQDVPKQPRVVAAGIIENMTRNLAAQKQEEPDRTAAVEAQSPVIEAATPEVQSKEIGIQRECAECASEKQSELGEEGKDLDEMSVAASGIQTKLTVGAPGDVYEQEADRVAAQVMSMSVVPEASRQVQRLSGEDQPIQRWFKVPSITPVVQRRVEPVVQMWQLVQRAGGGQEASGDLESRLNASKGGGSPLAPEVRAFMEPRFGADFSPVRVHTGGEAVQMNRELGAQAFAHGSDIYYGEGKSPAKDDLTAHELTHVVQQGGGVHTQSIKETESCQHTPILKVISYIHQEMIKNVASADVAYIRDKMGFWQLDNLIPFKGPVDIIDAYWRWYTLVKTGGPWDHKAKIMNSYGKWSFDRLDKRLYSFDIWSNIHYGYIGLASDIPEWDLLSGAGIAQKLAGTVPPGYEDRVQTMLDFFSALDDPLDQEAIKIGFELWRSVKTGVAIQNIHDAARTHAARLATQPCR